MHMSAKRQQINVIRAILITLFFIELRIILVLQDVIDRIIVVISMLLQLLTFFFSFYKIKPRTFLSYSVRILHLGFAAIMALIPLIAKSRLLLGLHACLGVFTLLTRRVLQTCIFRTVYGCQDEDMDFRVDIICAVLTCYSISRLVH